ncbi:MAG: substrate-binding domain-containing protein [Marinospirillum sp.]|uniref:substrate-binding domain-containing protein n=1 Tax=Marinospirillum sp. TaxID=2183934 RepID=UPI0019EFD492|nr:substrate-binding domain-containing protein [Marinospirillum sp.]MBE0507990.1 substrate-binding domain-containing protein [Marinospirillum sp.]
MSPETLRLISTISPVEAGLVDLLANSFKQATGHTTEITAAGTGQAMDKARTGAFDLLLVHAPQQEQAFVAAGHATGRYPLLYSDFVLLGPESDPANIRQCSPQVALQRIAATQSAFLSRADGSGTHIREQELWQAAEVKPQGQWYRTFNEGHRGNQATLLAAEAQQAYLLMDRVSYLSLKSQLSLTLLVEQHPLLVNAMALLPVNPERHQPPTRHTLALAFISHCCSLPVQELIRQFRADEMGETLFFPDSAAWHALADQS